MNHLKMDIQLAISTLTGRGWSQRRIARELDIDRETVARYRKLARQAEAPKPAIVPAGSEAVPEANPAISPVGSEAPAPSTGESNPAISPAGSKPGRLSHCEPFKAFIETGLDRGLSAQRIYQDLVTEQSFEGSYDSVKRFVRQLEQASPLPYRRIETAPGQEAQVDFGQGAWVTEGGRRRRPHVLRVVLSHSRKGYTAKGVSKRGHPLGHFATEKTLSAPNCLSGLRRLEMASLRGLIRTCVFVGLDSVSVWASHCPPRRSVQSPIWF